METIHLVYIELLVDATGIHWKKQSHAAFELGKSYRTKTLLFKKTDLRRMIVPAFTKPNTLRLGMWCLPMDESEVKDILVAEMVSLGDIVIEESTKFVDQINKLKNGDYEKEILSD